MNTRRVAVRSSERLCEKFFMRRMILLYPRQHLLASSVSMNYIRGRDWEEILLLPEALEDYIGPENPVRSIDAFVGQLEPPLTQPQTHPAPKNRFELSHTLSLC
jgi:hypothetical protein